MLLKRYHDKKNLITDVNALQLSNTAEVLIYHEDAWYPEVTVDLGGSKEKFQELKSWIVFVANHLCEMDYTAQKYSALRDNNCGFADGYVVAYISLREPDLISLTYYGTCENTEFDVIFQYTDDKFVLKSFGMVKDIDPNWDL